MTGALYNREGWGDPISYDSKLEGQLETIWTRQAVDALAFPGSPAFPEWSDNEIISTSMYYAVLRASRRVLEKIIPVEGLAGGELAYVVARYPRAFEMVEGFSSDAFMLEIFSDDVRAEGGGYSSVAWAIAWMQSGKLTNAGLGRMYRQARNAGLGFDDVVPYLLAGMDDMAMIAPAVEYGIDRSLIQSLQDGE